MKPSKNLVIIILSLVCLLLFGANLENSSKLYKLNKNLDKFEIEFGNWDTGETVFRMRGIPGYDISFALSNEGRVFWHRIGRVDDWHVDPGVCSDTPVRKYAYRPSDCLEQTAMFRFGVKDGMSDRPAYILYDLVNVDRHML
jgi:hypothetical protein